MEGLNSLLYAACNFIFYTLLLVGYSKSTEKHGGKLTNKFRLLIKKKSIIFTLDGDEIARIIMSQMNANNEKKMVTRNTDKFLILLVSPETNC